MRATGCCMLKHCLQMMLAAASGASHNHMHDRAFKKHCVCSCVCSPLMSSIGESSRICTYTHGMLLGSSDDEKYDCRLPSKAGAMPGCVAIDGELPSYLHAGMRTHGCRYR